MNLELEYNQYYLRLLIGMETAMQSGDYIPDYVIKAAIHVGRLAGVPEEEIHMMERAVRHPTGQLH